MSAPPPDADAQLEDMRAVVLEGLQAISQEIFALIYRRAPPPFTVETLIVMWCPDLNTYSVRASTHPTAQLVFELAKEMDPADPYADDLQRAITGLLKAAVRPARDKH